MGENENPRKQIERSPLLEVLFKRVMTALKVEEIDEETARMVESVIVLRISTKHINLWMRQLEMKRGEIIELARLMGLD